MEYVEPLNTAPISGAYAGREEINKMKDLMSLLGNPADMSDSGVASTISQPTQRRMPQNVQQKRIPSPIQRPEYIPGLNEVPLNEATAYDNSYYHEPVYQEPAYNYQTPQPQPIYEDVSFIKNQNAREAVEKYLNRGMNLYSERVQEIICLDESIEALKKDAKEIKVRYKQCKELNMEEAGKQFSSQYKQAGAKIKILEIQLKNANGSINEF